MELEGTIYTKVSWKEYLLPENNPRIKRFLRSKGSNVYTQIIQDIKIALDKDIKEIMMIVHRNAAHIVLINESEFDEILDYALNWFLKLEEYEHCAFIRDLKMRMEEEELIQKATKGGVKQK
jgi:hypothetical protein